MTDFDGNYTLTVAAGQTVEVTYVGYVTKTFKVGGQSKYDITLAEDNNSLDEVVVVGYGTMKRATSQEHQFPWEKTRLKVLLSQT